MSKINSLIDKLNKSEEKTVIVNREEYIKMLEELKKLRFKVSRKVSKPKKNA